MTRYVLEESTYVPIEDDTILAAEVLAVKEVTKPFKDQDTGEEIKKIEFTFLITEEGRWQGTKIWGETPTTFTTNPNCMLRAWTCAILRSDLDTGFVFDTDDDDPGGVLSQPCKVLVGAREYHGKNDPEGAPMRIRNYVKDVWRAESGSGIQEPF